MNLDQLAQETFASTSVLVLGAGASVESGAPTSAALAKYLSDSLKPPPDGDNLAEIAGIYENRRGRPELAAVIRRKLENLAPTGGMLSIPYFNWRGIYTTNFDRLVERAYQIADRQLDVVRSNYDYSALGDAARLYKIHGCISQDIGFGHQSRMVLTDADYEEVEPYRQVLFAALRMDLLTSNTIIVGHSLADRHLSDLARTVASLRSQGSPGRVFLVSYREDPDRAQLLSRSGIEVVTGSFSALMHAFIDHQRPVDPAPNPARVGGSLPTSLVAATVDVEHAATLVADARRLFNGAPARYADIGSGLTITRTAQRRLEDAQQGARGFFLVLAGSAGVGKTSLARSLMLKRSRDGFACWEHQSEYPFRPAEWLTVESELRSVNRQGVLLVDDCARHFAGVNKLVDELGALDRPFLRVVLTVNASQWKTRAKSRYFYSRGDVIRLSTLSQQDISEIVNLLDRKPQIRELVDTNFLRLGRAEKVERLRDRCSADMFVCMKNIFGNQNLDDILLQEFAALSAEAQDVYRHVAALQAMGSRVHRQLIVRLLEIDAGTLQTLLAQMEDVVSEYDIHPRTGLYGWNARHDVIASLIATYKYADQDELWRLLCKLIDNLNPTVNLELDTARSIASHDMGISRITDTTRQSELLDRLIRVVPAERTPRRRLIKLHLKQGDLALADAAIASARRDIGDDNIITRYRCHLAVKRAEQLSGVLEEDRKAMLLQAESFARECISRGPLDRYNYLALGDVGRVLARRYLETRVLEDVIVMMRRAETDIQEPEFASARRDFEMIVARLEVAFGDDAQPDELELGVSDEILLDSEG